MMKKEKPFARSGQPQLRACEADQRGDDRGSSIRAMAEEIALEAEQGIGDYAGYVIVDSVLLERLVNAIRRGNR